MPTRADRPEVLERHAVRLSGVTGGPPLVFGHGYGTSQSMWREVSSRFEDEAAVVLFDLVGSGASDLGAYDRTRYGSLHGYAQDLIEILDVLDLTDVTYVGHSAGAMVGLLAANAAPGRIARLVLVGASARYVNDGDYVGGFEQRDVDDLLAALETNYPSWARLMAPVLMATPDRPDLDRELTASLIAADPEIAKHFGQVTFLSDHRLDVPRVSLPTLILQSAADPIVPLAAAQWLHSAIPHSQLVQMPTTGHFPHMGEPTIIEQHIRAFAEN